MNKNDKNNENKTFAEIFKEKTKELNLTANKSINQNSVELSPNSNEKGQDYATNTHSPTTTTLGYGNISNPTTQRIALHTQQHRTGDTGNARISATLLTDLLAIPSTEQEFKQGNADITKRNRNEPTSTAKSAESRARIANEQEISRRGGAQSRESGAISQTNKDIEAIYRSEQLHAIEKTKNIIKAYNIDCNKPHLEKVLNDEISKTITHYYHTLPNLYPSARAKNIQETLEKINKQILLTTKIYNCQISPQNTKAIKNLLELGQDKAMKM